MTTISVEPVLRSRNMAAPEKVLSTFIMRYPRWIHAEARTHRLLSIEEDLEIFVPTCSVMSDPNLSRNASSSRAIPVEKMIKDVIENPAIPLHWGANQRGMQAENQHTSGVYLRRLGEDHYIHMDRKMAWLTACNYAIEAAQAFASAGYHKQLVNRLLEPFSHITVVVSATEWTNFIGLRNHKDAEPHIQLLAKALKKELERTDNIQELQPGEWHYPFVTEETRSDLLSYMTQNFIDIQLMPEYLRAISVACCASTSYKTVDGFSMTPDRGKALHDKLVGSDPLHASPAEHVAYADSIIQSSYPSLEGRWSKSKYHGNFIGFCQYRKQLPNEHI